MLAAMQECGQNGGVHRRRWAKGMTGGGILVLVLTWMWDAPGQVENATAWYQIISNYSPFIRGFGTIIAIFLVIAALVLLRMPEAKEKASSREENLPDAVQALEQRVESIEATLMSSEQKKAVVRGLPKYDPAGEVEVASDVTAISKDYAAEIRSTFEDAGWQVTASYLDKRDAPDGITVSGLASGLVSKAFEQADVYIKEDPTDKTGPTYIVVGLMKDKTKDKP